MPTTSNLTNRIIKNIYFLFSFVICFLIAFTMESLVESVNLSIIFASLQLNRISSNIALIIWEKKKKKFKAGKVFNNMIIYSVSSWLGEKFWIAVEGNATFSTVKIYLIIFTGKIIIRVSMEKFCVTCLQNSAIIKICRVKFAFLP